MFSVEVNDYQDAEAFSPLGWQLGLNEHVCRFHVDSEAHWERRELPERRGRPRDACVLREPKTVVLIRSLEILIA